MPLAIAAAALSALTLSGPTATGATTGILPASSALEHRGQRRRPRLADEAELGHRVDLEPDLVAEEADGTLADRGAQRAFTAANERADHLEPLGVSSRAGRPTNSTGIPARSISAEICGPAPWTTHTSLPAGELEHGGRPTRPRTRAADLHDDACHVR